MTKKIFVSLPMNGRNLESIRNDIRILADIAAEEFDEPCEIVDTIVEEEPPADISCGRVWYLGNSLVKLAEADVAVFHPGWRDASGCILEHMACALYNIPYMDISMSYNPVEGNGVQDYTHDWDLVGALNEEMSEAIAEAEGLNDIPEEAGDDEDALGFEHDDIDELEPGEYDADA